MMQARYSWARHTARPASAVANFISLVSRGLTVYASNAGGLDPATNVNDSDYNTEWHSTGLPVTMAFDVSSLGLTWTMLNMVNKVVDYKKGVSGQNMSTMPGNYTIEVNSAAGGSLPGSGWTTAVTVTGNDLSSRAHIVDLTGKNWIRLNVTQDAEGGTTGPNLNIDLWNVANATLANNTRLNCGWVFYGDSITAFGMALATVGIVNSRSCLGDQIFANIGKRPFQQCAGHEGYKAGDIIANFSNYLAVQPALNVVFAFGTNEGLGGVSTTTYYNNMLTLVDAALADGRNVWLNKLPWNSHFDASTYAAEMDNIIAARPQVKLLVDHYAYFNANQSLITGNDGTHPTGPGYVNYLSNTVTAVQAAGGGG